MMDVILVYGIYPFAKVLIFSFIFCTFIKTLSSCSASISNLIFSVFYRKKISRVQILEYKLPHTQIDTKKYKLRVNLKC